MSAMVAATATIDVRTVLLDILVVLVAAKVAAEVAERVNVPAVLGEILAGVLVGPSVLRLVGRDDQVLRVLGEIGVILLLLQVGLEMDLGELGAVGRAALLVAVVGVIVPFAAGGGVALALGQPGRTAVFVGAALTATSVGITARVFGDLKALTSVEARTVLGAAVADDVLGLVILTVVVRISTTGTVSVWTVLGTVGLAVAFLVVTTSVGVRLTPLLFTALRRVARAPGTLIAVALAFTLAFAELAQVAKLAPIVGAFVAGLALGRSDDAERIRREFTPVGHLFIPVFFLQIGIDADIGQMGRPSVLALAGALLTVAVVGKLAAPLGALGSPGDKVLIGVGMLPRGEVGLIFAGLGLREGILGGNIYAALLLVILATTLITPPLLRWRLVHVRGARRAPAVTPRPAGGWLTVRDGVIDLLSRPPDTAVLDVVLQASILAVNARPGPTLLDWLGELASDAPVRWDRAATAQLLTLLRVGTARSWRLLDAVGLLERALPELATVVHRRQANPFELDPAHGLRWALLERVRDLAAGHVDARAQLALLEHPDWLLLGALVLDSAGDLPDGAAPVAAGRSLVKRLDLGAAAEQEVALLVGESELLRAAARRPDAMAEETVLQMAVHLERPERARALYLLSMALGELQPWEQRRLDDFHTRVQAALARPELTGRAAANVVEKRRGDAARLLGQDPEPVRATLAHVPRAWALAQDAAALARQARLGVGPWRRGQVRVAVTDRRPERPVRSSRWGPPSPGPSWQVEVAARDEPGLLARTAAMLAAQGYDVLEAGAAVWDDAVAVIACTVTGAQGPVAADLQASLVAALGQPLTVATVPGVVLGFDDDASPWYTLCTAEGQDRPGLLAAVCAAFAGAGVHVHSARAASADARVLDRFELTDRAGGKLDDDTKAAIGALLTEGGSVPARRRRRAHRIAIRPKQTGHVTETATS